jgi:probable F420-dependent oxidoreductase
VTVTGAPIKIGIQLPHFGPLASGEGAVRLARHAEALGLDSVWVGDHLAYPPAFEGRFGRVFYEALTTLAFVAARTEQVRLGTAATVLPFRSPILLAKQLATLDALSGGRVVAGVGLGSTPEELRALGLPTRGRGAAADEAIRTLRALWTEEEPLGLLFGPQPRGRLPLLVAGNSEAALARAARLADGWIPIWHAPTGRGFTPEALAGAVRRAAAIRAGIPAGDAFEVVGLMPFALVEDGTGGSEPLVGPPEAIRRHLDAYAAAGLTEVILSPFYGLPPGAQPRDLGQVEQLLERLVRGLGRSGR